MHLRGTALGAQHDFERRPAPWSRDQPETAADRGRPGPHVLQALAGRDLGFVEAGAIVHDTDEAQGMRIERAALTPRYKPANRDLRTRGG